MTEATKPRTARMYPRHNHKFQRLSDTAIFCECGTIKAADGATTCNHGHHDCSYWHWHPSVWFTTTPAYVSIPSTTLSGTVTTSGQVTTGGVSSYDAKSAGGQY